MSKVQKKTILFRCACLLSSLSFCCQQSELSAPSIVEKAKAQPEWIDNFLEYPDLTISILNSSSGWEYFLAGEYHKAIDFFTHKHQYVAQVRSLIMLSLVYRYLTKIHVAALKLYINRRDQLKLQTHGDIRSIGALVDFWGKVPQSQFRLHQELSTIVWKPCPKAVDLSSRVGCGQIKNVKEQFDLLHELSEVPMFVRDVFSAASHSTVHIDFFDPMRTLGLADGYLRRALDLIRSRELNGLYQGSCFYRRGLCVNSELVPGQSHYSEREKISVTMFMVDSYMSIASSGPNERFVQLAKGSKKSIRGTARGTEDIDKSLRRELWDTFQLGSWSRTTLERRKAEDLYSQGRCREALGVYQRSREYRQQERVNGINSPVYYLRLAETALCAHRYMIALNALRTLKKSYPAALGAMQALKLLVVARNVNSPKGAIGRGN